MWKTLATLATCLIAGGLLWSCGQSKADPKAEAPPPAHVEHEQDLNVVKVDHPEQFSLATAGQRAARSQLAVTGTVNPDVREPCRSSRWPPAASWISAPAWATRVKKGQLLMRVQSADISGAFSDYRKAVADEILARTQLDRAKDLYEHGAIALNDFQVAAGHRRQSQSRRGNHGGASSLAGRRPRTSQRSCGYRRARFGRDHRPASDQCRRACKAWARIRSRFPTSPTSGFFATCTKTILPSVRLGETADIRLNAYPERVFKGKISNIGAILDPNIRTAKVRIEVRNPGMMRLGMFVTATFHGLKKEVHAAVPASAILHLHDRDWVFVPAAKQQVPASGSRRRRDAAEQHAGDRSRECSRASRW